MLIYLSSIYKKIKYIKNSRIKCEALYRNLNSNLVGNPKVLAAGDSPSMTQHGPCEITTTDLKQDQFPFENLVLGGGGAKGVAYCGVAKALEEHGILKNIKNFAGTSAGAVVAALLCIGFDAKEIEEAMNTDLVILLKDAWAISVIPNLVWHYGMHPAHKFKKYMGDCIAKKTKNPNITFLQLYYEYHKQLRIVVTNVNTMSDVYFDATSTPDMPIIDALRMSISIPGIFQAVSYTMSGKTSLYVDGGFVRNYPVHCFDGKDGESNKTLGCLVYNEDKYYTMKDRIDGIRELAKHVPHNTKLSRKFRKWLDEAVTKEDFHVYLKETLHVEREELLKFCDPKEGDKIISIKEFEQAWNVDEKELSTAENLLCHCARTYSKMLLGPNIDANKIFKDIQKSDNNTITEMELLQYCLKIINLIYYKYSTPTYDHENFTIVGFALALFKKLTPLNMTFAMKDDDARTIRIHTVYIKVTDFAMEEDDRKFLIDQGRRYTEEFLKYFEHNFKKKAV